MVQPPIPTTTQAILRWAQANPHGVAVLQKGQSYTWLGLALHVAKVRAFLAQAGVQAGQLVVLHCPNAYLSLILLLATESLGAIHASLATQDLRPEHPAVQQAQFICAMDPPPSLAADPRLHRLDAAWEAATAALPADLAGLAQGSNPADPVRLGWTSGTTGAPKFMLNTRGQISAILTHFDSVCRPVTPENSFLCFHGPIVRGVYLEIIRALHEGVRVIFSQDFTWLHDAGPLERLYTLLLSADGEALARNCQAVGRFLNFYYVDITGSMVSPAMWALMQATISRHIFSVYSSNETNSVALSGPDGLSRVVPACAVMLVDARGQPVPPGAVGQVRVRSPRVVDGYLWDPALTACHFQDGWFLMSDLASMPEPGVLRLLGRVDDMLNIGGRKLAPYPREQRLKALPGVTDALLLQRNNALAQGELVLLLEGPSLADAQALLPLVAQALGDDIGPYVLHFTPALPRTPTGKPQREEALRRLG